MNDMRTQYIACFLVVLALASIGAADHFNWRDLANAGGTVLGFGGGILMGKHLGQANISNGGPIVNGADPEQK